ncbi:MAG: DUF4258 domain-containing protein [Alphaproteobacteria bacterium]|nr:DUF4258 domain-containing protein [Alphaproteobacteria bacterium]
MTTLLAEKKIRELAQDSKNIIWDGHCVERSEERGITFMDALRVLRSGDVRDEPARGKYQGEWQCKVVKNLRGNRDVGVVTVIMTKQGKLKIKTVEWEDLR